MIPQAVRCEECGKTAVVRGYGRVVYDWNDESHRATTLIIRAVNLTIDCPKCGVRVQEYCPVEEVA